MLVPFVGNLPPDPEGTRLTESAAVLNNLCHTHTHTDAAHVTSSVFHLFSEEWEDRWTD